MKKRFAWNESFSFVKAKRRAHGYGGLRAHIFLSLLFFTLFLVMNWFTGGSGSLLRTIAISLASSLAVGFPGLWLLSFVPNNVVVDKKGIGSAKTHIPYEKMSMISIGHVEFGEEQFPVLTFVTNENFHHMYGLAKKISPVELREYLERIGVQVGKC